MYPVKHPKRRRWLWALMPFPVSLMIAAGLLFGLNRFTLQVELPGDQTVTLDYGSGYQDPGGELVLRGSHIWPDGIVLDQEPEAEGAVDPDTVGDYRIVYSGRFLWYRAEAERLVRVVDRDAPEIYLNSDPNHITAPGEPYAEEGFQAWDAYDGDITDRVQRREEEGKVYYTVEDSSGNRCEVVREIIYRDELPPEITLAGEAEMRIGLGTLYQEPGFTALDGMDGNLTESVRVSGYVDHRKTGTYTLTYTVQDESGNETTATRLVTVETAQPPRIVQPEGKVIYLTFDDGPGPYTEQLLAILAKYDVKATFFVIGNNTDMMRKITEAGHSIGIHTVSHNYRAVYSSEEAFFEEVFRMQDAIYEATGVWTTLLRFPGGSSNTVSSFNKGIMTRLTRLVQEQGFQYYDWNVDSDDAGRARTDDRVFQNVVDGVSQRNCSVVLQHDIKDFSVEAVERIILWGLENGYTFLPLEPSSPNCHHGVNN